MATITLVATRERLLADFPTLAIPDTGIPSADYQVQPGRCSDPLGRWLAEQITSTDRTSEGSRCILLYPVTEAGKRLRSKVLGALEGANDIASQEQHSVFLDGIRAVLDAEGRLARSEGAAFFALRTESYRWPVFGSAAAWGATTPEAYFDACARHIRSTLGAVILSAGREGLAPPSKITAKMAGGKGIEILSSYQETQRCAKD